MQQLAPMMDMEAMTDDPVEQTDKNNLINASMQRCRKHLDSPRKSTVAYSSRMQNSNSNLRSLPGYPALAYRRSAAETKHKQGGSHNKGW
jgi:hypothetical protein